MLTTHKSILTKLLLVFGIFVFFPFYSYAATDTWEDITPSGTDGYEYHTLVSIEETLLLGTDNGVYVSSDMGENWSAVNSGLSNTDVREIAIAWVYDSAAYDGSGGYVATSGTPVAVATAGGVFLGTLGGSSWTASNNGLTDTDVYDIEYDAYEIGLEYISTIYAATPSGVFRSQDMGANWTLEDTGMEAQSVIKLTSDWSLGVIYAVASSGAVYVSDLYSNVASDESWSEAYAGSPVGNDLNLLDPAGEYVYLAAEDGVYKDDGTGSSWEDVSTGLPAGEIRTVRSDYMDANLAYAAHASSGVYRTTDEATGDPAWFPINLGLTDLNIKDVRTTVGSSTLVYAAGEEGVYRLVLSSSESPYPDLTPPAAITDLVATSTGTSSVQLTWTAPGDDENTGTAVAYSIRYATSSNGILNYWDDGDVVTAVGSPAPSIAGSSEDYTVNNLPTGTTLYFGIRTIDNGAGYGDISNVASSYSGTPPDVTAPSTPAGLNVTTQSATAINLSWSSSTDNVAVTAYQIFRCSGAACSPSTQIASSTLIAYSDTALNPSTLYRYSIRAVDAEYNISSASSVDEDTTSADASGPSVSITSPSNGSTVSGSSVTVSASASDNVAVAGVQFKIGDTNLGSEDTVSAYSVTLDTTVLDNGSHSLTAVARDSYGNYGTSTVITIIISNSSGSSGGSSGGGGGGGGSSKTDDSVTPAGNARNVSLQPTFSWKESSDAIEYIIYIGTSRTGYDDKPYTTVKGTSFVIPETLKPATEYYWRVDSVGTRRTSQGVRHSFTTGSAYTTPVHNNTTNNNVPTPITKTAPTNNTPTNTANSPVFYKVLNPGDEDEDVRQLQKALNSLGYTIAESGDGSPGNESTYFGQKTILALQAFQRAKGIVSYGDPDSTGYGNFGPSTLEALNQALRNNSTVEVTPTTGDPKRDALLSQIAQLQQLIATLVAQLAAKTGGATTATTNNDGQYVFNKYLAVGDEDIDVKQLQIKLNKLGFTIASTGEGSPGNESTYFGLKTVEALKAFQCYHNIACSGSPFTTGYGNFGPSTREVINRL